MSEEGLPRIVGQRREHGGEGRFRRLAPVIAHLAGALPTLRRDGGPGDAGRVVVHLGEHVGLVAPQRLGRVHGRVRVAQQLVDANMRSLPSGDADGDGDRDLLTRSGRHALPQHQQAQLLGHGGSVIERRLRQHEHELLAPVATHEVGAPDVLPKDVRHAAQHAVAHLVAVRVVDGLEVIEVNEGDGQRPAVAGGPLDLAEELRQQGGPVGHAGQAIGGGRLLRLPQRRRDALQATCHGRQRAEPAGVGQQGGGPISGQLSRGGRERRDPAAQGDPGAEHAQERAHGGPGQDPAQERTRVRERGHDRRRGQQGRRQQDQRLAPSGHVPHGSGGLTLPGSLRRYRRCAAIGASPEAIDLGPRARRGRSAVPQLPPGPSPARPVTCGWGAAPRSNEQQRCPVSVVAHPAPDRRRPDGWRSS